MDDEVKRLKELIAILYLTIKGVNDGEYGSAWEIVEYSTEFNPNSSCGGFAEGTANKDEIERIVKEVSEQ